MKKRLALLVLPIAILISACGPRVIAGPPPPAAPRPWTYSHTYDAVNIYFGQFGPHIVDCANRILDRESNHWPYSDNGTHHGTWQLHNGFWNSIQGSAAARGEVPDWYNPYQNTNAAGIAFVTHGYSFRVNWRATVPRDCP